MSNEAIYSRSPLYRALLDYTGKDMSRFHTPGHKGANCAPLYEALGGCLALDVTELPETDSLFDADGPIHEAEKLASAEFGTSCTLFSAGGATLCIQAMLRLASRHGKKLVCARNVHRSAVNAMCLLGLEPVWVWPRRFKNSGLPGRIAAEDVDAALAGTPEASCVFLTSPDYYGVLSDIRSISAVCRRHRVPLLVDNSHGSHLFYTGENHHPLRLGADLCCDSAHKTLPVLTGGAYLQVGSGEFTAGDAKAAMALFGSTSPSYLVMLSLDLARSWLHEYGRKAFGALEERVRDIRLAARETGFYTPPDAMFDPVRITLDFASVGTDGNRAAQAMRKAGISPEMSDGRHVVLLPSPMNSMRDFEKLYDFIAHFPVQAPSGFAEPEAERPAAVLTPREACMAPCETVPSELSAHRISAESRCPCPPGIPLIMPGERITPSIAARLKNYGVFKLNVLK